MTTNQYTVWMRARVVAALMASILLLVPRLLEAQGYTIAPIPFLYVWNTSGAIVTNGCVWTYAAGTTTPIATYSDNAGTPNGNPIIADTFGRFVAYLLPGTNYKFQYEATPCNSGLHGALIKTQDNIQGVPSSASNVDIVGTAGEAISAGQCVYLSDGSGSKTQGQWYKCDSANTYSSTLPVVGFAPSAISSATTGTIRIAGYLTGLSSLTVGAAYYVSGTVGGVTATAPANRRLVGVADTTTTLVVAPNPAVMVAAASGTASNNTFLRGDQTWSNLWTYVTTTSTGTQNNFDPGIVGNTVIRANNASDLTITGWPAGFNGQQLVIESVGSANVFLQDASGGAGSTIEMANIATSGLTPLSTRGSAAFVYDATSTLWRMVAHEQGAWLTQTYAGTDYTASAGTWTVASGDVNVNRYRLSGRSLTWVLNLSTTSTSATPASLQAKIPGGLTVANVANQAGVGGGSDNGAARAAIVVVPLANDTKAQIQPIAAGNWAVSVDLTSLFFVLSFEVQ